jgi:acyl-CoA synthetase (AMP-forming)/AMP-acid ligase II
MHVLGDLVGTDRRTDTLAYERPGDRSRSYSYSSFCTDAWKAGNLMRHYGVRAGASVGIVDGPKDPEGPEDMTGTPTPESLLALFGASLLGAEVRFDPPRDPDVRALVGPDAWLDRYDLPPGSKAMAYGGPPEDPTKVHFERELWSENPIPFPEEVDPESVALAVADEEFSHERLLSAAEAVVEEWDLGEGDRVAVDAPLTDVGTIVAGVLAPLFAGGTITVGEEGTVVVSETQEGENVLSPTAVREAHSLGRT